VAGDKRNGDDLFEDLDKFFAPIKDVDWEEPASTGTRESPGEEHVSVRPGSSDDPAPADSAASQAPEHAAGPEHAEPDDEPDDEVADEDWYDTSILETIDGIGADDDEADAAAAEQVVAVGEADDDEIGQEVVGETVEPGPGQTGLFAGGEQAERVEDAGTAWAADDAGDEGEYAEATLVGDEDDLDTETAPIATIDELMGGVESPDDAELEQATEYFAPSVREEAGIESDDALAGEGSTGWDDTSTASPQAGGTLIGELGPDEVEQDILSDLGATEPGTETVTVGAEGLGGPSWQEPGALEVGGDVEHRGPEPGERDVPAAFLTGVVLAIAALAALLIGDWLFGLLAAAVVLLAQGELFGVMVKHHRQPATAVGLVAGALMLAAGYFRGEGAVLAMFVLGVAATFLWFMAGPAPGRKDSAANIGLTVLNMAWVPLLGSYLFVLLEGDSGTSLVVSVIGLTFVYDTAAFLSGSVWGGQFFERPLAPTISPKKSVEGVIIGTLVTVVVAVTLVTSFVDPFENQRIEALLLGLVVAAAATFGDLAESLVKRDVGIKDMGSILPGHGGVLDRIDSLLFVAPAAFFLYRIIVA
jgi:phosphatidate cytidylyltransferase